MQEGSSCRSVPRPHLRNACRLHVNGLGSSGFARRYSRNHNCFLFLWVLRWFTSPRSPFSAYAFSGEIPWLSPRRVSPFGHLRINVRVQLPEAFRSLPRPSSQPSAKASAVNPYSLDLPSMNLIELETRWLHLRTRGRIPRIQITFESCFLRLSLNKLANLPRLKTPHGPQTMRITLLFALFTCQRCSSSP